MRYVTITCFTSLPSQTQVSLFVSFVLSSSNRFSVQFVFNLITIADRQLVVIFKMTILQAVYTFIYSTRYLFIRIFLFPV